jgi:eukaryotic-like serine/threonine-protein kinase
VYVSTGPPSVVLPALVYKSEADAIATIQGLGLTYGTSTPSNSPNVPAGQVIAATLGDDPAQIAVQTSVPAGSTINLIVSNGLVSVPDQKGQPITTAQANLQSLQLTVKLSPDRGCTGQNVTGQSAAGEMAQKSTITLTYCNG